MEDLIYRQDAIKLFSERKNELGGIQGDLGGAMSGAVKLIESLPSAEPKKGKWIDEGWYADGHYHHAYCCSKCGEHYIKCPDEIIKFKYCPNCGAKMEEENR